MVATTLHRQGGQGDGLGTPLLLSAAGWWESKPLQRQGTLQLFRQIPNGSCCTGLTHPSPAAALGQAPQALHHILCLERIQPCKQGGRVVLLVVERLPSKPTCWQLQKQLALHMQAPDAVRDELAHNNHGLSSSSARRAQRRRAPLVGSSSSTREGEERSSTATFTRLRSPPDTPRTNAFCAWGSQRSALVVLLLVPFYSVAHQKGRTANKTQAAHPDVRIAALGQAQLCDDCLHPSRLLSGRHRVRQAHARRKVCTSGALQGSLSLLQLLRGC